MKFWLAGVLGAMVLAGCASKEAVVPQVHTGVEGGNKVVRLAPEKVQCSRHQCPVLGADWTAAKKGQAVLTIGLPYQQAEVTGADFHFANGEILRVRSASQTPAASLGFPATAFDVPLRTVERIAYAPRSWVRVYTAEHSIDESINTGDEGSRAFTALHYFMVAVQAATGEGPSADVNQGGLMDRLGLGDKKER